MRKYIQVFGLLVMILLAVIPYLVIYEGVSAAIPVFPNFKAPDWFIPVGFINIALIVIVALLIGKSANKD
ncbi:hypothetical protein [Oceanobacillus timonensis]|uniref:hypothetical protein n=1 Tax=Oceanobacillus timonensis TaxID=1926285 RepID=UPI0009BBAD26|nr:hypothetical protein [Oceanobacillus timonensis]